MPPTGRKAALVDLPALRSSRNPSAGPVTKERMEWLASVVSEILARWGYLALAGGLLGENAGLPLPGETILMYASFVAHKDGSLNILWVILVGTAAAVVGDNLGYLLGRRAGPHLFHWLKCRFQMDEHIAIATDQIRRHGPATVFWARYIFGLRTITGPVAGALNMTWKKFLLFNALGAVTWVTSISLTAYFFANKFDSLASYIEKGSWGISGAIFAVGYFVWRKKRKHLREGSNQPT